MPDNEIPFYLDAVMGHVDRAEGPGYTRTYTFTPKPPPALSGLGVDPELLRVAMERIAKAMVDAADQLSREILMGATGAPRKADPVPLGNRPGNGVTRDSTLRTKAGEARVLEGEFRVLDGAS